ncbi:MAG: peptidoglycan DD-metalloendopeptidase family protein [Legionella sp.]|uniref:peptidoglycan DD-metalloendopeptidase family protein n=1 Tax=Legionella sp. TaxID=459 RepID=UPI0039E3E96E
MQTFCKGFLCLFFVTIIGGCGSNLAPVTELKWQPYSTQKTTHIVRREETLFAIAFRYDTDYRTLARLNHLNPPYSLKVGQVLSLQGIKHKTPATARSVPQYQRYNPKWVAPQRAIYSPLQRYARSASGWLWPVSGRVVTSFIPEQGKKGINIACRNGGKVIASSSGTVAYAGSGLRGYGNLIIIKHNHEYLTAYGNNAKIIVSEGQFVNAGQVIAEAGIIDHKYTGVHFEIRKAGVPVNPLNYLQKS